METNKFKLLTLAGAVSIALSGCLSGDGDTAVTPVKLSGVVADGYLENATVCLDLNENKACDADEPQAITDSAGAYSFDTNESDSSKYPVISIITSATKDADEPGRTLEPYIMSAPAGKPDFISPMTTMIQTEIESNPGMSADEAEGAVKTNLGYNAADEVSLFKDYVAAQKDSTGTDAEKAEYKRIHRIAQVTARTLEENHTLIEEAATASGLDKDEVLNELVRLLVRQVILDMNKITTQVDAQKDAATFDVAAATTSASVNVSTDNLEDDVAAEQTVSDTGVTDFRAIISAGIHFLGYDYDDQSNEIYETRKISLDSDDSTVLKFESEIYNEATKLWTAKVEDNTSSSSDNAQVLTKDGLVVFAREGSESVKQNSDGTITIVNKASDGTVVEESLIRGAKIDLAGKKIRSTFPLDPNDIGPWYSAIPGNSIFTTGSEGYRWSFTSVGDVYRVRYQEVDSSGSGTCADYGSTIVPTATSKNCRTLRDNSGVHVEVASGSSIADLADGTTSYYVGGNMTAVFTQGIAASAGTVDYTLGDATYSGVYSVETPFSADGGAIEVLLFTVPRELREQQDDERSSKQFIFVDGGYARMGGIRPGSVTDADDDFSYNLAALGDIKNCFKGGDSTGICPVNIFLKDRYTEDANGVVSEKETIVGSLETGVMVPYVLPTDITLRLATGDSTQVRWIFELINTNVTPDTNGYRPGNFRPHEVVDGAWTPKTVSGVEIVKDMLWKVTPNGRLKIKRNYTKSGVNYYDYWMVTQLKNGKTHVRFKRFNQSLDGKQEKNFGSYMTHIAP